MESDQTRFKGTKKLIYKEGLIPLQDEAGWNFSFPLSCYKALNLFSAQHFCGEFFHQHDLRPFEAMCFNSETQRVKIPIYPQGKNYFALGTMNIFALTHQHTSRLTCRKAGKVTVSTGTRRDNVQKWQGMTYIVRIPRGGANEVPLGHGK